MNEILLFTFLILATSLKNVSAGLTIMDELFHGVEADRYDWSKHPCNRQCSDNQLPMVCEYLFIVETYKSMSKACYSCPRNITDCFRPHCLPTDGHSSLLHVVNRNLPGPHIQVCEGDTIIVDVSNMMRGLSTSIHWHGIRQKESPYADGVPFVTQCPIPPITTFQYQFIAQQAGTYFWHAHIGGQRAVGLFGGLTIRQPPRSNVHVDRYDYDVHSMIINDWKHESEEEFFTKINHVDAFSSNIRIPTLLVNGHGRFENFAKEGENPVYTPVAVFNVKQGYRYRFRLVNAGAGNCPVQLSVDNHTMTIISADGNDIEPVEVDTIYMWPGERYDFIITANQAIDNYWIRYRGLGTRCALQGAKDKAYQVAILRYQTAPIEDPKLPVGWEITSTSEKSRALNPIEPSEVTPESIFTTSLKDGQSSNKLYRRKVDEQFYISLNMKRIDNYEFHRAELYGYKQVVSANPNARKSTPQLDHITFDLPPFPLLSQRHRITPDTFCNATTTAGNDCINKHCTCPHVLQVKLNSLVELVIVDESRNFSGNHPMHLHGHFFEVVAEQILDDGITVERVKQLDREGKIKRITDRPPVKDTVRVPTNGIVVVRFYADNPGYWYYHCHYDSHVETGLALIFKVGEDQDMLPVPENFPQCGNYQPHKINKF